MSGRTGRVQVRMREKYPHVLFVHCYAHQLNLVMQKISSCIPLIKIFFANLSSFSNFFSMSPKRMAQLDHIISQRVARGSATRWNFHGRTVNSVYEMKEDLIACFSAIMNGSGWDTSSISEASGLKRWLEDSTFLFFLDLFHQIFPHIELLFSVFQSRRTSISLVADAVRSCIEAIQTLRDDIDEVAEQYQSDHSVSKETVLLQKKNVT